MQRPRNNREMEREVELGGFREGRVRKTEMRQMVMLSEPGWQRERERDVDGGREREMEGEREGARERDVDRRRERERRGESLLAKYLPAEVKHNLCSHEYPLQCVCVCVCVHARVCVCVCVCACMCCN